MGYYFRLEKRYGNFHLNKNQKYKKLQPDSSALCNNSNGPCTFGFGYNFTNSMTTIKHYANSINEYYDRGSEILQSNNQTKEYDLIEAEVYKIIIE